MEHGERGLEGWTTTSATTATAERDALRDFWAARGQPWRTEPEIDEARQGFLAERRATKAVPREGIFRFAGVRLARADVEWLLATHDDQGGAVGPVDWSDPAQRKRRGLDLRGADLRHVDLSGLPLANLLAESPRTWDRGTRPEKMEEADPGIVRLDGANLDHAHLEGALFGRAALSGASLRGAFLTQTSFLQAYLEGACLDEAWGEGTYFSSADLTGASLRAAVFADATFSYTAMDDVDATGAHLTRSQLNTKTMNRIRLDDAHLEHARLSYPVMDGASLRRAHLEDADLTLYGEHYDLTAAHLERAQIQGSLTASTLALARCDGATLMSMSFRDCVLDGACFDDADLTGASFYANDAPVDLSGISFARANLQRVTFTRVVMRGVRFDGVNLAGAKINGGECAGISFVGANLSDVLLTESQGSSNQPAMAVDLSGADLRGAVLVGARCEGVRLVEAHLEGADCTGANFSGADLSRAYLAGARLDHAQGSAETVIDDATLQDREHGGAFLGAVRWGGADIARTHWQTLTRCGEDHEASRARTATGQRKDSATRIAEYGAAVRFYRQLAISLAESDVGLDAPEERYLYRAQVLQRRVFWHERNYGRWAFSLMLAALSGYGYRLERILVAYLAVLLVFAGIYVGLGAFAGSGASIDWSSAFLASLTAFHGRVFATSFALGSPQAWASAIEGICGLIIESVFIAVLTNKLFSK